MATSALMIVAEPGCCHQGDFSVMVAMLNAASQAGASAFKPQYMGNPGAVCARRRAPSYRSYYEWLNFPTWWHERLADMAHQRGMAYGVTTFLVDDVAKVDQWADFHKCASFENGDTALIRAQIRTGKPVMVSTGMMRRQSWAYWQLRWWRWRGKIRMLQCTTQYPASADSVDIGVVRACDGLSDHSRNVLTGAVAVGAGAQILETHFRLLDCDPNNPDYAVAFTPHEFATYIRNVREAERMMGDGVKKIQPSEQWALPYKV